jgi:hypothetical protein
VYFLRAAANFALRTSPKYFASALHISLYTVYKPARPANLMIALAR